MSRKKTKNPPPHFWVNLRHLLRKPEQTLGEPHVHLHAPIPYSPEMIEHTPALYLYTLEHMFRYRLVGLGSSSRDLYIYVKEKESASAHAAAAACAIALPAGSRRLSTRLRNPMSRLIATRTRRTTATAQRTTSNHPRLPCRCVRAERRTCSSGRRRRLPAGPRGRYSEDPSGSCRHLREGWRHNHCCPGGASSPLGWTGIAAGLVSHARPIDST